MLLRHKQPIVNRVRPAGSRWLVPGGRRGRAGWQPITEVLGDLYVEAAQGGLSSGRGYRDLPPEAGYDFTFGDVRPATVKAALGGLWGSVANQMVNLRAAFPDHDKPIAGDTILVVFDNFTGPAFTLEWQGVTQPLYQDEVDGFGAWLDTVRDTWQPFRLFRFEAIPNPFEATVTTGLSGGSWNGYRHGSFGDWSGELETQVRNFEAHVSNQMAQFKMLDESAPLGGWVEVEIDGFNPGAPFRLPWVGPDYRATWPGVGTWFFNNPGAVVQVRVWWDVLGLMQGFPIQLPIWPELEKLRGSM